MLYDEILCRVDKSIQQFIKDLSMKYTIDFDELCQIKLVNEYCQHRMANGKNKGQFCTKKPLQNGYCNKHQIIALKLETNTNTKSDAANIKITKTQEQIIQLLKTPNPSNNNEKVQLVKHALGNFEPITGFMLNDDFCVIGKLVNTDLVPLNDNDKDLCDVKCWDFK